MLKGCEDCGCGSNGKAEGKYDNGGSGAKGTHDDMCGSAGSKGMHDNMYGDIGSRGKQYDARSGSQYLPVPPPPPLPPSPSSSLPSCLPYSKGVGWYTNGAGELKFRGSKKRGGRTRDKYNH